MHQANRETAKISLLRWALMSVLNCVGGLVGSVWSQPRPCRFEVSLSQFDNKKYFSARFHHNLTQHNMYYAPNSNLRQVFFLPFTWKHEWPGRYRKYSSYSFLTSAVDGADWSASSPGRALYPWKGHPVPIVQEAGWAPEPIWTQRYSLCRESNPDRPVVNSIARHYIDWATPAPNRL
jgi:hypothetical protein